MKKIVQTCDCKTITTWINEGVIYLDEGHNVFVEIEDEKYVYNCCQFCGEPLKIEKKEKIKFKDSTLLIHSDVEGSPKPAWVELSLLNIAYSYSNYQLTDEINNLKETINRIGRKVFGRK